MQPDTQERLAFSVEEAAKKLGISKGLLYRLRREGKVKFVKLCGRTLMTADELARLLTGEAR